MSGVRDFHSRVSAYYQKTPENNLPANGRPALEDLLPAHDEKHPKKSSYSTVLRSFSKFYPYYFPEGNCCWKIANTTNPPIGLGIFATRTIKNKESINGLVRLLSNPVSRDELHRGRRSRRSILQREVNGRIVATNMRGPAAFLNYACNICSNVRPAADWEEFTATQPIYEGQQLFVSYVEDKEAKKSFPFECLFCTGRIAQDQGIAEEDKEAEDSDYDPDEDELQPRKKSKSPCKPSKKSHGSDVKQAKMSTRKRKRKTQETSEDEEY